MKNLEKTILKKIYQYETKRTIVLLGLELISFIFLGLTLVVFGQVIIEILVEQNTLDILQLFGEDFEVIRRYFLDTVYVFYLEVPKILLVFWLIFFASLSILISTVIKNFPKLKNKIISLLKFWI